MDGWVYFVRAGKRGPIKIGWAVDPERRLKILQIANHKRLRLLGACAGGAWREAELHVRLDEYRIRGEWFRPTPEVLAVIEECLGKDDDWDSEQRWQERSGMMPPGVV